MVTLNWRAPVPGETLQIFRSGKKIADPALGTDFRDPLPATAGTACYSLTTRYAGTGLTSLPSRGICVAPAGLRTIVAAAAMHSLPNDEAPYAGRGATDQYSDWGAPDQELRFEYTAPASGLQRLKLRYANANGPINTGITAAVKTVTAQCGAHRRLQSGTIVMPQLATAKSWSLSTGFFFAARRAESCTLRIVDGFNMSYLRHFELYTGGQGGKSGPLNRASIAAAELEVFRD